MTAPHLPQEPAIVSCSERIARLAAACDQAGRHAQAGLVGVHLGDAASVNALIHGRATCIFLLHRDPERARLANDADAPFRHCYRVQPALAAHESPAWEVADGPSACLSVQLDLQVAAELILTLDDMRQYPPDPAGMRSWIPLDDELGDTVLRLLQALRRPIDAMVLGPGILRELLYRVLTGPQGAAVRAAVGHQGSMRRIGKALRRIRESYAEAVDVAALANEAGMSIAAFHTHFKAVTQTTPIQFLKTTACSKPAS